MATIEVKVPAIGDFKDVPIIDVLVNPGDAVKADDPLVTLESEKSTMDVPSPAPGTVRELKVKVGDKVSEGSVVLTLDAADAAARRGDGAGDGAETTAEPPTLPRRASGAAEPARAGQQPAPSAPRPQAAEPTPPRAGGAAPDAGAAAAGRATTTEVKVPPIGDFEDVPIIEVLVKAGDEVTADQPLVTLESEKATMDVPAPSAGTVRDLKVKVGDRVSEGSVLLVLEARGAAPERAPAPAAPPRPAEEPAAPPPERAAPQPTARAAEPPPARAPAPAEEAARPLTHASPSVRKLARELGADLSRVEGSGPKGRILREDVQRYVKETLSAVAAGGPRAALDIAPWPRVDFAKFGRVETQPLSRIQKLSRTNLSRNWVMIPHVTQHDEANITELERFRLELNEEGSHEGVKVTLLAFVVKACVAALRKFPVLNSSLDGDQLVLKRYFHIGFAADTKDGLVVPVIRDADQKGVIDVARELAELAARAREGKLSPADMQGGSFTISSLGGIGGTAFTPIINAPEVAILGVSRSVTKPVWDGEKFAPALMLPLSLSYDHRVVDGALAARFTSHLAKVLGDFRRAML